MPRTDPVAARQRLLARAFIAFLTLASFALITATVAQADQTGQASWYGAESCTNPKCLTASGQRFDPEAMSAAHLSLPFGTTVGVTNQRNSKRVVVVINDRGPARHTGRVIDMSRGAARALGFLNAGTAPVHIRVLR